MLFRNAVATARSSGAVGLRGGVSYQATRSFATEMPKSAQQATQAAKEAGSNSNIPLILALGGLGGLGAWYYMGGFDGKKPEMPKAVAEVMTPGALNSKEFKEFTLKEIKPYNHDSST